MILFGCQEQGSSPAGLEDLSIRLDPGHPHPHPGGGGGNDDAETFNVTISSPSDADWTNGTPQEVEAAGSSQWLHVFDSGGNGTRGRAKYPGTFSTEIFLQPTVAAVGDCHKDPANMSNALRDLLFSKLNQGLQDVVFDFQVSYDIAESPEGFSIFQFRWEAGDRIFSVRTGFGLSGSDPAPTLVFLGANPDDIDNPAVTRVFRISGAKAIAEELNKNKVIATLSCPNEHVVDVTVAPVP